MNTKIFFILFLVIFNINDIMSQNTKKTIVFSDKSYHFNYDFTNPKKNSKLNHVLREISALTYLSSGDLATVQDEKGIIYILNRHNGEIKSKIKFAKDGDFEGIEIVGENMWILKSNGTLYETKKILTDKSPKIVKYPTFLNDKNNTEGLGYDPKSNCLLIACKGAAFADGKADPDKRAIYSFDLVTKKLNYMPFMIIDLKELDKYRNFGTMAVWGIEFLSFLDPAEGDITFKPSAIAVHPITGNIYILASSGKLLTVFTRSGKLLAMINLDVGLFNQPEGICFSPNGTLYISNEGDKKNATLLKFTYNI